MGGINEMIYHWGVLGVCFAVGRWQATMARRAERARQQAVRAEAAAAEAVLTERKRIARELHDIVAHARRRRAGRSRPSAPRVQVRSMSCGGSWACCVRTAMWGP